MKRCLELALLGAGHVAPNPMVGAVLVFDERIIGEGYHERYGEAHAEVNCIRSVRPEDLALIGRSTMYVSLEPCAHHGKTPPCADLIIKMNIPRVVVGCRDPFKEVNGKGIEKLLAAGITVDQGVLEEECIYLNRRFFTFNVHHRPWILLKWAQSANGKIATYGGRTLISNEYTNRLVHKWRSEEASILVGTNTALSDDPELTARLWNGPDPVRLVVDKKLRLPRHLKIFDGKVRTIVFNAARHDMGEASGLEAPGSGSPGYYQLAEDSNLVHQLVIALYQLKIQSVLVEGGAKLLQSFIDEGYWDEARIITNKSMQIPDGLAAPELGASRLLLTEERFSDTIQFYGNPLSSF